MNSSTQLMWSGFSRANRLNPAQRHRWRLVLSEVFRHNPLPDDAVVVDLGCGSGSLLSQVSRRGPGIRCVGLDVEPLALDLARKALPDAEFHQVDLSASKGTSPMALERSVDAVVCSEVLEHLEEPAAAVELASSLLKPGGVFIVTVPAGNMTAFDRAIGHVRHYDPDSLSQLLQHENLELVRLYRWGFPFHSLFRAAIGMVGAVPSAYTDANFGMRQAIVFRLLDWLFMFNIKSLRLGRQLVAVARRRPFE